MAINPVHIKNFNTMLKAAKNGDLALLEAKEKATGLVRAVIVMVGRDKDDYTMTPLGHFCDENPFDAYYPAAPEGGFHGEETED